jgi:hypothetical protein
MSSSADYAETGKTTFLSGQLSNSRSHIEREELRLHRRLLSACSTPSPHRRCLSVIVSAPAVLSRVSSNPHRCRRHRSPLAGVLPSPWLLQRISAHNRCHLCCLLVIRVSGADCGRTGESRAADSACGFHCRDGGSTRMPTVLCCSASWGSGARRQRGLPRPLVHCPPYPPRFGGL